jgi:glycosyltransferase involved in cell wall biosynthesis
MPDVLLIPANKNTFNNTSKNYVKFLELAYLNIPVLAPNIKPYSDLISTNKNGFLCDEKEDYLMQMEAMFEFRQKFDDVLGSAYATVMDYDITIKSNIDILSNIYFPQKNGTKDTSTTA